MTASRMRMPVVGLVALVLAASMLWGIGVSRSASSSARVLLVGTWKGHAGQYTTIQSAVDAANPGDWILVAPGDYRESADSTYRPTSGSLRTGNYGSVLITKAGLHLRGLNRNTVIVDGTKSGPSCSSAESDQNYGVLVDGQNAGRNGIVVYKANNVDISNLTTCNFLSGSGDSGNNIWWNGGAGSGGLGLTGYSGSYLNATDTYYGGNATAGTYGIFSSDAQGSKTTIWDNIYASNFNDSGMYVGACQRKCNITINHARMEYNALGYSGTNSGGSILIENSLFQYNQDGLDTNTQIAGDPPPPQDGSCPAGEKPKIKGAHNCWILYKNTFQYNNQIVPTAGNAGDGPMGTGLTIAGGRNDSLIGNTFKGNKAWGVLVIPFADSDTPPAQWTCASSGGNMFSGLGCIYDPSNIEVVGNTFSQNGAFGNPTNGDIGQLVLFAGAQQSCYSGNVNKGVTGGKATTFPTSLQTTNPTCTHALVSSRAGAKYPTTSLSSDIVSQVLCDTGFGACPAGNSYPGTGPLAMHPLPTSELASMPNPCLGVPSNAWCSKGKLI